MKGLWREVVNEEQGRKDWGVGRAIFGAEWLEGNKMLAAQPRPYNLVPIIGFPGEFLVMFRAGKTQG